MAAIFFSSFLCAVLLMLIKVFLPLQFQGNMCHMGTLATGTGQFVISGHPLTLAAGDG
jgi:hypothetical protein